MKHEQRKKAQPYHKTVEHYLCDQSHDCAEAKALSSSTLTALRTANASHKMIKRLIAIQQGNAFFVTCIAYFLHA